MLEASTVLLREEEVVGQVMDLVSPPWAPACARLAPSVGFAGPLVNVLPTSTFAHPPCARVVSGGLDRGGRLDAPTHSCGASETLGGRLTEDTSSPPLASSTTRTAKEVLDKLVDGESVPINLLSQFEAAIPPVTPGM